MKGLITLGSWILLSIFVLSLVGCHKEQQHSELDIPEHLSHYFEGIDPQEVLANSSTYELEKYKVVDSMRGSGTILFFSRDQKYPTIMVSEENGSIKTAILDSMGNTIHAIDKQSDGETDSAGIMLAKDDDIEAYFDTNLRGYYDKKMILGELYVNNAKQQWTLSKSESEPQDKDLPVDQNK